MVDLRKIGALTHARGLSLGDHVCWAYSSDDDLRRILIEYFTEGLPAGQRLVYFSSGGRERELVAWLDAAGHDGTSLVADGRLVLGSVEDVYAPGGRFDPDERIAAYRAMVRRAIDDGFTGLRVCGDAAWVLRQPHIRDRWPAYELRADLLAAREPFLALCSYDLRICDVEALRLLHLVHACSMADAEGVGHGLLRMHGTEAGALGLTGEIDAMCADDVRAIALDTLEHLSLSEVDLTRLSFADVSGVRAIADIARTLAMWKGPVEVHDPPVTFRRIWSLLDLDRRVPAVTVR